MIANLAMYARPETSKSIDRLWVLIRGNLCAAGMNAPELLSQDADLMTTWTDPGLVLSQTCGMPFRKFLHDKVQLVGAPHFDLSDCPAGHYYSTLVVHKDDPRKTLMEFASTRLAFNEENSQSGFAAVFNHAISHGVGFASRVPSGSHAESAQMVAKGQADIASLDAVTWELIQRYDACAADLRVLENTTPTTPALPFITSSTHDPKAVYDALEKAIAALPRADKSILCLKGVIRIPAAEYLKIPNPMA